MAETENSIRAIQEYGDTPAIDAFARQRISDVLSVVITPITNNLSIFTSLEFRELL